MPTGPIAKEDIDFHWKRQKDHIRADLKNIYDRMMYAAEREAFKLVMDAYKRDGTLLDLHAEPGALEQLARDAVKTLPESTD